LGELDGSFAGLAFVGQHAKAGTPHSHITHTQWFSWIDLSINGISIGEYGQCALVAMERGVPTILACGEEALAKEAADLTPGVVTVAVKRGLLPDGLEHLDTDQYRAAKLGAVHLSPTRARQLIRAGAKKALEKLKADPRSFRYPDLKPPYIRKARFRKQGEKPAWESLDRHETSMTAVVEMEYTKV
jgi:D-amino peptidase